MMLAGQMAGERCGGRSGASGTDGGLEMRRKK